MPRRDCWVVLQWQDVGGSSMYCFQGVFDDESVAVAECRTNQYLVIPATMNESIPHDPVEFDEQYFPLARI